MRLTLVMGLIGLSALLFACSSDDSGSEEPAATAAATATGGAATGETTVEVKLSDFAIAVSTDTVPAGEARFEAENVGSTPHELVLIKTDLAHDALPIADSKVDESQVNGIGEIEEFPAGESQTGSFELEAGAYVLICNVVGHYQLGMHIPFTVE